MTVHELTILCRDGRAGRTQKEGRRTENGTAPANAHGGALGIDIMKRCGWPPGTATQQQPRECTEHRTRGRMPAEKACTEQHGIRRCTPHAKRSHRSETWLWSIVEAPNSFDTHQRGCWSPFGGWSCCLSGLVSCRAHSSNAAPFHQTSLDMIIS